MPKSKTKTARVKIQIGEMTTEEIEISETDTLYPDPLGIVKSALRQLRQVYKGKLGYITAEEWTPDTPDEE